MDKQGDSVTEYSAENFVFKTFFLFFFILKTHSG